MVSCDGLKNQHEPLSSRATSEACDVPQMATTVL